jgi:hypothetical protein
MNDPGFNHARTALEAAVPLWQIKMQDLTFEERAAICREAQDTLRAVSEFFIFKGKSGQSAQAFNAVARGIAALSFMPGGCRCFGIHWEPGKNRSDR